MWKKTKRKLADLIRSASFTEVGVALDYSANWQTRVERVKASAEGLKDSFLYIITVKGITGARAELPADLTARLDAIRAAVKLPIAAGFGISTQAQADVISQHADGFVVGSALVKRLGAEGRLSGTLLP